MARFLHRYWHPTASPVLRKTYPAHSRPPSSTHADTIQAMLEPCVEHPSPEASLPESRSAPFVPSSIHGGLAADPGSGGRSTSGAGRTWRGGPPSGGSSDPASPRERSSSTTSTRSPQGRDPEDRYRFRVLDLTRRARGPSIRPRASARPGSRTVALGPCRVAASSEVDARFPARTARRGRIRRLRGPRRVVHGPERPSASGPRADWLRGRRAISVRGGDGWLWGGRSCTGFRFELAPPLAGGASPSRRPAGGRVDLAIMIRDEDLANGGSSVPGRSCSGVRAKRQSGPPKLLVAGIAPRGDLGPHARKGRAVECFFRDRAPSPADSTASRRSCWYSVSAAGDSRATGATRALSERERPRRGRRSSILTEHLRETDVPLLDAGQRPCGG